MTQINTKLGVYILRAVGTERNPVSVSFLLLFSEAAWNTRNKKEGLRRRPASVLACGASSCLGG